MYVQQLLVTCPECGKRRLVTRPQTSDPYVNEKTTEEWTGRCPCGEFHIVIVITKTSGVPRKEVPDIAMVR